MGTPALTLEGERLELRPSRPTLLLFYLAAQSGWVRRDELAFFLRPDADRETGLMYLRKLLSGARKLSWGSGLEVESERVRWCVQTDLRAFERARREERWFEATELYGGPFLGGVDASFLPGYEIWMETEREVLASAWWDAALSYAGDLEVSGQHRKAASMATKLLEQDTFSEAALHSYVRNSYLNGQREQALKAAHDFERQLLEEFDLPLTPATQALISAIREARPVEKRASVPRYGRRRSDTVTTAKSKKTQLAELTELLATPDSRLVSVGNADSRGVTLVITKRVPDAQLPLLAVVDLAAQLIEQGHRSRALELLLLALNHPSCTPSLREQIDALWPGLGAQFTFE